MVEVSHDQGPILTDMAFEEAEIDEDAVKNLEEKPEDPDQAAAIEATIAKSLAQLKIKRKSRQL